MNRLEIARSQQGLIQDYCLSGRDNPISPTHKLINLRVNSNLLMAVDGSIVKWRVILVALDVDIGTGPQQLSGNVGPAVVTCFM